MSTKTSLRAKFMPQKGVWRIIKKSNSGKWKMFGGSEGYAIKLRAEQKIQFLIECYPELYEWYDH